MKKLIDKYLDNTITDTELEQLLELLKNPSKRIKFEQYLKDLSDVNTVLQDINYEFAYKSILNKVEKKRSGSRFFNYKWVKYAAILILFLGSGYVIYNKQFGNTDKGNNANDITNSISKGEDRAILTLEDGSDVVLEKDEVFTNDKLSSNGHELVYSNTNNQKEEIEYNYLTIPRGGQYHLKLADGSEIWLNSETKLKYPVSFIKGQKREVELIYGEAYFDVAPSTSTGGSKFVVVNQHQNVEVLGTEFNVKAYKDENNIYTTLVEGSVAVNGLASNKKLSPSQQSILNIDHHEITVNTVDVFSEVSWRYGLFSFKSKSLNEIMRVLARWYDFEIEYINPEIVEDRFHGVLRKDDEIEKILQEFINAKFIEAYEIKNKRIILN